MDNTNEIEMFSPEEMQSPFDAIKETDGEGREWWSAIVHSNQKILNPSDNCDEQGVLLYNLDAIIAVGYRVNSYEATQFRIWAREVLKEYIIKGFVMDDERLKGKKGNMRNSGKFKTKPSSQTLTSW